MHSTHGVVSLSNPNLHIHMWSVSLPNVCPHIGTDCAASDVKLGGARLPSLQYNSGTFSWTVIVMYHCFSLSCGRNLRRLSRQSRQRSMLWRSSSCPYNRSCRESHRDRENLPP